MTRGEKSNLLRLIYRLESLAKSIGEYYAGGRAAWSACRQAEAEIVQVRQQIESALGFTVVEARKAAGG